MTTRKLLESAQTLLSHPRLPTIVVALAIVLSSPALWTGFESMDDLRHRAKLLDRSRLPARLLQTGLVPDNSGKLTTVLSDMHTINRTKADFDKLRDYGLMHWWTQPDYRASNWRPLDSFTHWLDYRLWPDSSVLIHAHSIFWFAAIVLLVTLLYKRLLEPLWVAGLAALMYLLDDSNYLPALWIANRCLLSSLVMALLSFMAYHKWRSTGAVKWAVLSNIFLLACLLASEAGIAAFAFLFAYVFALEPGTRRGGLRRALSLLPAVVVIIAWRMVYSALGNGAYGSGFVIDPVREPLSFARALLERGPILLFAQLGGLPSETYSFIRPSYRPYLLAGAYIFLMLVLIVLFPLLRRDRLARFWFLAMLLATVPICATLPMNRNLLYVAVPAFALLAQFIKSVIDAPANENPLPANRLWRLLARGLCAYFILAHLLFAVVGRVTTPVTVQQMREQFRLTMDLGPLDGVQDQDLVVVNAPNPFSLFFVPLYRAHLQQPLPNALRVLAPGFADMQLTRVDQTTLNIRAKSGNILSGREKKPFHLVYLYQTFNEGFRHRKFPMRTGDKVVLPRLAVEVLKVDDKGLPVEITCRFAAPLDDPSLRWLAWDWHDKCYVPFVVPAVGQAVELKGRF
jgi:hypothetical protein